MFELKKTSGTICDMLLTYQKMLGEIWELLETELWSICKGKRKYETFKWLHSSH